MSFTPILYFNRTNLISSAEAFLNSSVVRIILYDQLHPSESQIQLPVKLGQGHTCVHYKEYQIRLLQLAAGPLNA
jgi:hypothetical protein